MVYQTTITESLTQSQISKTEQSFGIKKRAQK
jgi:hypothetical protein